MDKILLATTYLPPIEYFAYLVNAPEVKIELFETYPKQTYRNRCKIYTANGVLALSIPVEKPNGKSTITKDILISNSEEWQKKHWRAIESAYSSSPYFEYYKDELKLFYTNTYQSLVKYNHNLLKLLLEFVGVKNEIGFTTDYDKDLDATIDLRNKFNPKKENPDFNYPKYYQVFDDKHGFAPNLSIIDLIFSEGPNTLSVLQEISI